MKRYTVLIAIMLSLFGSCGRDDTHMGERTAPSAETVGVIDSVVPIPLALDRFRADIEVIPTGLDGEWESAQAVVREVVRLLAAADTLAFEETALNRAEFAYLYYETSVFARPPYELSPALMWFQLQQGNRIGVLRLLRELGGQSLVYGGHECAASPIVEGDNRIWPHCRVQLSEGGKEREVRLFSALIERNGKFKVLSFENDF